MREMIILAAAAALVSVPAQAADLQNSAGEFRTGAFVGARLRLPLDAAGGAKPQALLTLALTQSYRSGAGRTVTRLGEGVALDFAGRKPMLTIAGVPASSALGLRQQGSVEAKRKLGISTGGWIAIGVVAVAAVVAVSKFTCVGEDKDHCGSD